MENYLQISKENQHCHQLLIIFNSKMGIKLFRFKIIYNLEKD